MSTKEKIIDIVVEMLKNNISYDNISMNKVAEKAGIGKSTIYEYFDSKNDLLAIATEELANTIISGTKQFDISKYDFHEAFVKQISLLLGLKIYRNFAFNFFQINHDYLNDKKEMVQNCLIMLSEDLKIRFMTIFTKGILNNIIKENLFNQNSLMLKNIIIGTLISCDEHQEVSNEMIAEKLYNAIVKILN